MSPVIYKGNSHGFVLELTPNRYSFDNLALASVKGLALASVKGLALASVKGISLRCINRFSILLAQNDRLDLSFRLRGRSTSSLFKKSLSDRKCAWGGGGIYKSPPPPLSQLCGGPL